MSAATPPAVVVTSESKLLSELRVIDLRNALEVRNLDKSGVKAVLVDRLKEAMRNEGVDPDTHRFDVSAGDRKSTRTKPTGDDSSQEDNSFHEGDTADSIQPEADAGDKVEDGGDEESMEMFKVVDEEGDTESPVPAPVVAELPPPPDPEDVPPQCPFTVDETVKMHAAAHQATAIDTDSMCVNTDDLSTEMTAVASTDNFATSPPQPMAVADEQSVQLTEDNVKEKTAEQACNGDEEQSHDDSGITGMTLTGEDAQMNGDSAVVAAETEETAAAPTAQQEAENDVEMTEESIVVELDDEKANDDVECKQEEKTENKQESTENKAKKVAALANARHLWVSELTTNTRATDLKTLFSQYGKVAGAKIMTSSKTPGSKCFGFVAMSTPDEAAKCIANLHRSDLKGKIISVERVKDNKIPLTPTTPEKAGNAGKKLTPSKKTESESKSSNGDRPKSEGGSTAGEKQKRRSSSQASRNKRSGGRDQGPRPRIVRGGRGSDHRSGGRLPSNRPVPSSRYSGPPIGRGAYRGAVRGAGAIRRIAPPTTRGGSVFTRRPLMAAGVSRAPPMGYTPGGGDPFRRSREDPRVMMRPEPFDRRELEREMRRKEEEYQQREERLRLEREKERLKAEREKIEREKLELQQLRLSQQLAAQQQQMANYGQAVNAQMAYGGGGGGYAMGAGGDRRYDVGAPSAYHQRDSREDMRRSLPTNVRGGSPRNVRDIRGGRDDRRIGGPTGGGARAPDSFRRDPVPARRSAAELPRSYDMTRYGGATGDNRKDNRNDYGRESAGYPNSRGTLGTPRSSYAARDERRDVGGGSRRSVGGGTTLLAGSGSYATGGGNVGAASNTGYHNHPYQQNAGGGRMSSSGGSYGSSNAGASAMWQAAGGGQSLGSGGGGSWGVMQQSYGSSAGASGGGGGDRFDAYKYAGSGGRRY